MVAMMLSSGGSHTDQLETLPADHSHCPDGGIEDEGKMPYVRDVRPLVGPVEGDGDLRPGAIAMMASSVLTVST